MRNHRFAYRTYDRLVPRADPHDPRFDAESAGRLARSQRREARYRHALLSQPILSLADMQAKAGYLLGYAGDDFLISDRDELALLLRAMARSIRPWMQ
jgi:hypothetical protein